MKIRFNAAERENISVNDLASLIGYILKEHTKISNFPPDMLKHLYEEKDPSPGGTFLGKFYEAIGLLQQRGLIVYYIHHADFKVRNSFPAQGYLHFLILTSAGREIDFSDEILILDDAQKTVNSLRNEISSLDDVVSQYYLQSIRTCQQGSYPASVICLGAASERAINCLVEKVNKKYHNRILARKIANRIEYLKNNFQSIFGFIGDDQLKSDLKDRLSGFADMYRRNRNHAGHPGAVALDITRDEQVCYLHSFRIYTKTLFKAIEWLQK